MTGNQESKIVEEVLKGNTQAFAGLVNSYQHLAVTLAFNILLNREDAEDVAQEAFVKAYSSLKNFKGDARFSTWLYRIVVNMALNKRKRKKLATIELNDADDNLPVDGIDVVYQQQEQVKYIRQALLALSEAERVCISMFYLNELSVDEICSVTGYTSSNVKVLLHRGRKHLYAELNRLLRSEVNNLIG